MSTATAASLSQFPQRGAVRLGRHEVLLRLGAGGMATVYLARSVGEGGFERLAALKVLHPHLLGEQAFLAMFLDEARVAARIHHPNVVAIQDLAVEDDRMYTVMDYVLGDTLAAAQQAAIKLRRGLPLEIVLRVGLDALRGLDAAHELTDVHGRSLQVVHRDATPHNILVGVDGVSRVTDFGIAKAESRISFTGVGTLKGKAPYMAPEQFTNRRIDRRADVFSMAVTIWEALALRRCLPPDLSQPLRRPPYRPLGSILRDVPPELDAVLARGLKLNPDERWRTAGEFADAIERQLRDHVAPHKAVAAFVRAFAHAKVEREREAIRAAERRAQATPRAVASLRGQSGFLHSAGARAPLVAEALPEPSEALSPDELEPPTRVMPPKPSRAPSAAPTPTRAPTPRGGTALVPAPPARPRLMPTELPAAADESGTQTSLRSLTLPGTGHTEQGARAANDAEAAEVDELSSEAVDEPGSMRPDELLRPEEVFVSIPPPSIAPAADETPSVARARTVLDPEREAEGASDSTLSLLVPSIPKAPKVPDVRLAAPSSEAPALDDQPSPEARADATAVNDEPAAEPTAVNDEPAAEPTAVNDEPAAEPTAEAEVKAEPTAAAPTSMAWSVGFGAALITTFVALWSVLAR